MNKVILIGRLTKDPELRTTASNYTLARFSIAVNRPRNPQLSNQPEADFINCIVWGRQAENLSRYCHKGQQIAIEGRIQTGSYTAQDGTKRYTTDIVCDNITFLSPKQGNAASTGVDEGNNGGQEAPNYEIGDNVPTVDISEDPYKDFGEEVVVSDDDLPF